MSNFDALTAPYAFARFWDNENPQIGLVAQNEIRPISANELGAPCLNAFLSNPDWDRIAELAESEHSTMNGWRPLEEVTLTAPVEPRQVIQAGANYREHVIELVAAGLTTRTGIDKETARRDAAEMMDDRAANGEPYFFIGLPSCVVGDDVELTLPSTSDTHDWELELAIVIGAEAFRVSPEKAMEHVAGYTIVNDISTREYTFRKDMKEIGTDWYRSKNAPGFLPTGPFLVPAHFINGADVGVRLELNGEVKQDARTSDLLFDIPTLISVASQTTPLLPGDLLLTGSPSGNGQHWKRFLRDGDVLTGTIEGLGTQTIRCIAEDR